MVNIVYDPARTTPEQLVKAISVLGYGVKAAESRTSNSAPRPTGRSRAPVPKDAPQFFREAFEAARKAQRPIVLDFWASWCPPCLRLKKETLEHPDIATMLDKLQLIYVDLDEHPDLGESYGVVSVPDVIFIDRDGFIADRLQDFEAPGPFRVRLGRLLEK